MTSEAEAAAAALMGARRARQRLKALPAEAMPADIAAAYHVQEAVRRYLAAGPGGRQIGWKIGCTNETAQRHVGIDEPFYGGIFERSSHVSPATVVGGDFFMTVIEAEVGFLIGDDLPAAAAPYDPGSVGDAVAAAVPAIEIVDSRYLDWTTIGAAGLIADNGSHGAWVRGAPVQDWQALELAELEVRLFRNDEEVRTGHGGNVMGHPLNALTWLANVRAIYGGEGLAAGDWVSTGTTIHVYEAKPGDRLRAEFGTLGVVELNIS